MLSAFKYIQISLSTLREDTVMPFMELGNNSLWSIHLFKLWEEMCFISMLTKRRKSYERCMHPWFPHIPTIHFPIWSCIQPMASKQGNQKILNTNYCYAHRDKIFSLVNTEVSHSSSFPNVLKIVLWTVCHSICPISSNISCISSLVVFGIILLMVLVLWPHLYGVSIL
jgi:hypothetical protein